MTAEPDLPINDAVPAPTKIEPGNLFLWNWRQMQVYSQACVAHATAAKAAEVEALRAEVERVTCELMDATTRADKLAEALREARRVALLCDPLVRARQHPAANSLEAQAFNLVAKIDALLREQEEGYEQ